MPECFNYSHLTQADLNQDNLGKSVVLGLRNIPKQGDEHKVYGLPTIRTDISPPRNLSIGNYKVHIS